MLASSLNMGITMLRWYDTAGYIYKGQNANLFPPYFPTEECVVDMDSVGMSYLVPVEVFKENKYEPPTGFATEHYSICQAAKRMGYRVLCDLNITIIHAFLPKYGEDCH